MSKPICPNCYNQRIAADDKFCWNCGMELGNCCENPDCHGQGSQPGSAAESTLPDEFTYCPYCGSETRYARLGFAERLEFEPQD